MAHQCADIITKSLTRDKFERFRETIRGAITYNDMVKNEMELNEAYKRVQKEKIEKEHKTINLLSVRNVIREVEEFGLSEATTWPNQIVNSNHYSKINFTGRVNPLQSS